MTDKPNIRNRIKEMRIVRYGDLVPNPENWRGHPDGQKEAYEGIVESVGFAGAALSRELPDGRLMLIDGHMRRDTHPDAELPVLVTDLNEDEARMVLLTYDPISAMAQSNNEILDRVLRKVNSDNAQVQTFLSDMAQRAGIVPPEGGYGNPLLGGGSGGGPFGEDEDDLEEGDRSGGDRSDGSLLALSQVTISEPKHQVERGDVWRVGRHALICAEVLTEWSVWVSHLSGPNDLFIPYPGPFAPLTLRADEKRLVMVQPDAYICGHILDRFAEIHGEKEVKKRD